RPDRPVGETADQDLALGGAPFPLEESAGDPARGIELLDIVDRQREEILAGLGFLAGDDRREDHGVVHGHQYGAGGLAGDLAGLEGDRVGTPGEGFLCYFEHSRSSLLPARSARRRGSLPVARWPEAKSPQAGLAGFACGLIDPVRVSSVAQSEALDQRLV